MLESDAISYHEHTKFFIENLKHGVFPLWDPFWSNGAPNDFFLRRIGALNPFYIFMSILSMLGMPYNFIYLWSLALYYWGGMMAFYLLAMRIYQDRLLAYAGYLTLLFSALGTRIFDSYMILVTVPLLWFFYFLVAFSQSPRIHLFLGIILTSMVLVSTYIPFYFIIVLIFFSIVFCLFYFDQIPLILSSYVQFIKKNKLLFLFSILCLGISFLPTLNFFKESMQGHLVMPVRHGVSSTGPMLTVPHQTLDWGAVEDLVYSGYFSNLRMFKFAVVYVPFFSVIVLCLGFIGPISRKAAFIFVLGISLFCCLVPHGLPFYDLLYKHFFFFKFFRNLHFFIWFFLIPLFIFWCLEHWDLFKKFAIESHQQHLTLFYVALVHLGVFLFVFFRTDAVISTYVMIILSFIFWVVLIFTKFSVNGVSLALLTITLLPQPLEAYHYFNLKAQPLNGGNYWYSFSFSKLPLQDLNISPNDFKSKDTLYYATEGYNFIYNNLSADALAKYLRYKFLLVDHLQALNPGEINPNVLNYVILNNINVAFVYKNGNEDLKLNSNDPQASLSATPIGEESNQFKILVFDANHVRLFVDLPYEKFLIYNDSYTPDWHLTVNGQKQRIYEVNGNFKGAWLPSGRNIVEFTYGNKATYALNIFLSLITFIILIGLVWHACHA